MFVVCCSLPLFLPILGLFCWVEMSFLEEEDLGCCAVEKPMELLLSALCCLKSPRIEGKYLEGEEGTLGNLLRSGG